MTVVAAIVETVLAGAWRRDSSLHGEPHWWCVAATGLDLADADPAVDRATVLLFGLLHDTRRENDSIDPEHGPRAAAWTRELVHRGVLELDDERLERVCGAIDLHTRGQVTADATVGACWDADRLHLPRCGIAPDPALFSTEPGRSDHHAVLAASRRARVGGWDELLARL
jgi:uncharacterized protein